MRQAGVTSRFTVSLPADLLQEVDRQLVGDETSRSALIRRLLEDALRDLRERLDVERYVKGYTDTPQTENEFGWSDVATKVHFSELPK